MANKDAEGIKFKIVKHIGIISKHDNGWTKELNMVSWNGGVAKYDIRDWSADHLHMNKGITLREDEAKSLLSVLAKI